MSRFKHPLTGMLTTCLACHEREGDNRLADIPGQEIAATIRLAIEGLETDRALYLTDAEYACLQLVLSIPFDFKDPTTVDALDSIHDKLDAMGDSTNADT